MSLNNIILFACTSLVINATPGTDVAFILGNFCNNRKWKVAINCAVGLAAGYFFYILITYLGVITLFIVYPKLLLLLKILGALYLIWMGASMLNKARKKHFDVNDLNQDIASSTCKAKNYLIRGLIVSILNPKVGLFFLAFLPQFIPTNSTNNALILILGIIFCIGATAFNLLYCLIASFTLNNSSRFKSRIFQFLPGTIILLLGIYVLFN